MTHPTELDGVVVAVMAATSDDTTSLGIPLLEADASVPFCVVWSPFFNQPDEDDMLAVVRSCTVYPRRECLLTDVDGDIFYDLLSEPGWSEPVHARGIRRAFGRRDAVIVQFRAGDSGAARHPPVNPSRR